MVRVGSRIRITSDNENYDKYRKRTWKVARIYKDDAEHRGYDMGLYPQKLVECDGLPFALYEYEFDVV